MFTPVRVNREQYGEGENRLICGDITKPSAELKALRGRVQCVYADPPFMTGERFARSRPFGTKGWRTGSPAPKYAAYEDRFDSEREYLRFLRRLMTVARDLLTATGVFYLHLDWRMAAQGRVLCDQVFGSSCFMNEIIWAYESGGRSKKHFSRKHDTILLYSRGPQPRFDLTRVPLDRRETRKNHMARNMDENGRMYSSIRTNGKEYRYYDDEPVYPGDVWTDISHLQQRDPERTGFATQKPEKLLERLLLPVIREGDWVVDLCCGSGTALVKAQELGCHFAGWDKSPEAVAVALARLKPDNLTVLCPGETEGAILAAGDDEKSGRFRFEGLEMEHPAFPEKRAKLDCVESWETGRIKKGVFYPERTFRRSFRYPELTDSLEVAAGSVQAVLVTDAAGRRRAFMRRETGAAAEK